MTDAQLQGGEALYSFRALVSGNLASIYTSKGKYNEVRVYKHIHDA